MVTLRGSFEIMLGNFQECSKTTIQARERQKISDLKMLFGKDLLECGWVILLGIGNSSGLGLSS